MPRMSVSATMDDVADSEMSFGSCEGRDWSAASIGSGGPNSGAGNRKHLDGLRNKHWQCLQVLKKKSKTSTEFVKALVEGGDPESMERQNTADSVVNRLTTPVVDEDGVPLEERIVQIHEEATSYLVGLREAVEAGARQVEALQEQDLTPKVQELRAAAEASALELEQIKQQDAHIALREARQNMETCDKMGAQRLQDVQLAVERLKDVVRGQTREIEGLKAQASQQDLQAIEEALEAQGQGLLGELGPAMQGVCESVMATAELVRAQASDMDNLAQQIRGQQQETVDELQKLKMAIVMQARGDLGEVSHRSGDQLTNSPRKVATSPGKGFENAQLFADRGDATNSFQDWQSRGAPNGGRVPLEAVGLVAAVVVGAIFPLLLISVLRAVWTPAAVTVRTFVSAPQPRAPLQASPPRQPTGRPGGSFPARPGLAASAGCAALAVVAIANRRPRGRAAGQRRSSA